MRIKMWVSPVPHLLIVYPKLRNLPLSGFIEIFRKCMTNACLSGGIYGNRLPTVTLLSFVFYIMFYV